MLFRSDHRLCQHVSEAAAHKGIVSEVAGRADVLVAPDLNSGNMLAKSVIYLCRAGAAGVVTGASCPVVLTSRADTPEVKLNSIAVAAILGLLVALRMVRRQI